jgi:hypothetical protein
MIPAALPILFLCAAMLHPMGSLESPHALYIGMVDVSHGSTSRTLDIRVRVFADDLQSCVRSSFPEQYVADHAETWPGKNREAVARYFRQHLWFSTGGKKGALRLKSIRLEGELYWLSLEADCAAKWATLEAHADFFMEVFPSQSNMVHLSRGGETRYGRTTADARQVSFTFTSR